MNTKKIISVIIVSILLLGGGVLLWRSLAPEEQEVAPPDETTFPISTSVNPGQSSGNTSVPAFLDAPDTYEDPENPGIYYLGYEPNDTANNPYIIEYIQESSFFNISLTQEPIGESRSAAERYLVQRLDVTRNQMCALAYSVTVPDDVNSQYASVNLGFSFCPGAVELPE